MENRNTVIAIVLMAIVWLAFTFIFGPQKSQQPQSVDAVSKTPAPVVETVKKTPAPEPVRAATKPVTLVNPAVGQVVEVENELFIARFSSAGGRLVSLRLKNFTQTTEPDAELIELVGVHSPDQGSLRSRGSDGFNIPVNANFHVSQDKDLHLSGSETASLVFSWMDENGLRFEKSYHFSGNGYGIDLQQKVINGGEVPRSGTLGLELVNLWDESLKGGRYEYDGPATLIGKKVETSPVKKLAKESKIFNNPVWSLFETKYFMSAVAPVNQSDIKVKVSKEGELILNHLSSPHATLQAGQEISYDYFLFFGPRDLDILKEVGHSLDRAIDYGWFKVIAVPLRSVLNFFYSFVHNYGVAIIILTMLIKMLFWPLTHKSYASMKNMQRIQPEIAKLKDKFKNDKEKMNKAMMALYKEKRVNPFGGCLPMVVQIPFFFALYKVLMVDIGLRHAPFCLWLTDLSVKDPYYITPLIMGATMFVQQKMTPSTMDPKQAKMFMMMPVVFTFLFLNFPSGLVIYWLVNNLLTILQQYLIHRKPATA